MFLIVYATIGIPLTGLMLTAFGDRLKHVLRSCVISFEKKVLKRSQPRNIQRKSLVAVFVATIVCLSIMSAISGKIKKWDFSLAFYVWFVTLTTIGFGDYIPDGSGTTDPVRMALEAVYMTMAIILSLTLVACILHALSDWVKNATPPTINDLKRSLGHINRLRSAHREEPVTISTKTFTVIDANELEQRRN
jgi:hypothetical protein